MPISAANNPVLARAIAVRDRQDGFSLVELMVVLFVIGLMASLVILSIPSDGAALSRDADRLAVRIAAARDEAVIGGAPVALWIAPSGYGFERRDGAAWTALPGRDLAGADWDDGTIASVEGQAPAPSAQRADDAAGEGRSARIIFDTTGLPDGPASIRMRRAGQERVVSISATGEVGRGLVQPTPDP